MATSPDGRTLYVVGTDFDLAYASGALQAIDLAALDAKVDASPSGQIAKITEVPFVGGVDIAPLGGLVGVAPRSGGGARLFVPIRGGDTKPTSSVREGGVVTVVDATADGHLGCWSAFGAQGLADCRGREVTLLTPGGHTMADPFSVVVTGDQVIVGGISAQPIDPNQPRGTQGVYGARLPVSSPGAVQVASLGLAIHDMVEAPWGGTVFSAGRAQFGVLNSADLRSFEPDSLGTAFNPPEIAIAAETGSSLATGVRFSSDGSLLYAVAQSPPVLVVYAVGGTTAKDLTLKSIVPLPGAPSRMAVIPGAGGDLVAVTSSSGRSLAIVDPVPGRVLAVLDGTDCPKASDVCPQGSRQLTGRVPASDVGDQPFGVIAEPLGTSGARIWVSSASDSRLTAVDIPDLANVDAAAVRAVVTTPEAQ